MTAVEWLCNEWLYIDQEFDLMLIDKKIYWEKLRSVQEKAKAMEKEQIRDAFDFGVYDGGGIIKKYKMSGEQYYNETFKSE